MRLFRSFRRHPPVPKHRFGSAAIDSLNMLRSAALDREILEFVAFAIPYANEARGQLFQDIWALWEAGGRTTGYFVEVGAYDGIELSNTVFLEQLGWKGIVAEPNPDLSESLKQNRTCFICTDCVHPTTGAVVNFLVSKSDKLSRLSEFNPKDIHESQRARRTRVEKVRTISLNDLLVKAGAPRQIDFLSLDTEGSEFQIINALDFERWNIRTIAVEHNFTDARDRIFSLLSARGYQRKWPELSHFDDWYVRK